MGRRSFEDAGDQPYALTGERRAGQPTPVVETEGRLIAVVRQTGKGRASGLEVEARLAHVRTVEEGKAVRWEAVGQPEEALAGGA